MTSSAHVKAPLVRNVQKNVVITTPLETRISAPRFNIEKTQSGGRLWLPLSRRKKQGEAAAALGERAASLFPLKKPQVGKRRLEGVYTRKRGVLSRNLVAASIFHKKKTPQQRRKKSSPKIEEGHGIIHIQSTHNNTIYTLGGNRGLTRNWISAGRCGFKNARKSTSYASQGGAEKIAAIAKSAHIGRIHIKMKGLGPGKLSGVRALHQSGFRVEKIWECTTLPHNGCRPAKSRRV